MRQKMVCSKPWHPVKPASMLPIALAGSHGLPWEREEPYPTFGAMGVTSVGVRYHLPPTYVLR